MAKGANEFPSCCLVCLLKHPLGMSLYVLVCVVNSFLLIILTFHSVKCTIFRCECVLVCQSTPSEEIAHINFSFVKNNFLSLVLLLLLLSCVCCFALFFPCCFVLIVSYLYFLSIDWKTKFAFLGISLPNLFILLIFFPNIFLVSDGLPRWSVQRLDGAAWYVFPTFVVVFSHDGPIDGGKTVAKRLPLRWKQTNQYTNFRTIPI